MKIPDRIPGLRQATWLLGAYAVIWISLEGTVWRALLLGAATMILTLAYLAQRRLAGRSFSSTQWIAIACFWGAASGPGSVVFTLVFMSLKTGLHAHGPEFSPQEISWVIRQIPLWTLAGLSAGLGLGLLILSRR